jgi:hypothetical protein
MYTYIHIYIYIHVQKMKGDSLPTGGPAKLTKESTSVSDNDCD